jgi:hypothetical protein
LLLNGNAGGRKMNKDISAKEYFKARRPQAKPQRIAYSRIIRAMDMYLDIPMSQLCAMSDKELKRVRNIGEVTLRVIRQECLRFSEESLHKKETPTQYQRLAGGR